jgi:hypothetical protein
MCEEVAVAVANDLLTHLKMLKDGGALVLAVSKECHAVIKSDLYYAMWDFYIVIRDMQFSTVDGLIDVIEAAPKMFDMVEKFWLEQQHKRSHSKMFISEELFIKICNYILNYRSTRNKFTQEIDHGA